MPGDPIAAAAEFFKVLGGESRLRLLHLLSVQPMQVGTLAEQAGMTQPLVSQHLRVLRQAGIVSVTRHGREAVYQLADQHVGHVINDAIVHVQEPNEHTTIEGATP